MSDTVHGPMDAALPLVSVIVPSYNHALWIRETVESVWAQSYANVELIVVDDASTDRSVDVIMEARSVRNFTFLQHENNLGLNATIEAGLGRARGAYVSILASDDLIEPHKIQAQVDFLRANEFEAVYANGYRIGRDGVRTLIDSSRISEAFHNELALQLLYTCDTAGPYIQSGLFTARAARDAAPVRRRFKSDDWAFTITLLERYRVGYLDEPLFTYRIHETNTHSNYWSTFPMRAEVICSLTPPPLRREALANLLESQATYVAVDAQTVQGLRYLLAASALDLRPRRIRAAARIAARPLALRLGLTRRGWLRNRLGRWTRCLDK